MSSLLISPGLLGVNLDKLRHELGASADLTFTLHGVARVGLTGGVILSSETGSGCLRRAGVLRKGAGCASTGFNGFLREDITGGFPSAEGRSDDITGGFPSVELSLRVLSVVALVVVITIGRIVVLGLGARLEEYRATRSSSVVPVLLPLPEEEDSWSTIVTSSAVVFDISPRERKRGREEEGERVRLRARIRD